MAPPGVKRLNESKVIPDTMLTRKLVLGEFKGFDQVFGGDNGSNIYSVDGIELFQKFLVGCIYKNFYCQLYLEDACAEKGSFIENHYFPGYADYAKVNVSRQNIFTLDYLYVPKNSKLQFETGIIKEQEWDNPNYKLSKLCEISKLPKYENRIYETPSLDKRQFEIKQNSECEIIAKINNMAIDIRYCITEENVNPWQWKKNSSNAQTFKFFMNENNTFCIKNIINEGLVVAAAP